MERVWLDTDVGNTRAQAAYAKAGFVREGVFRHAFHQDGHWSDDVRMALLREEWAALPRKRTWDLVAEALRDQVPPARADPPDEARSAGE